MVGLMELGSGYDRRYGSAVNLDTLFSSERDDWETPPILFRQLNEKYHFTLDVCATKENAKCQRYFTKEENGLEQDWGRHSAFMNPPYGRAIINWVRKAYLASQQGATVVCLLPSRTDTAWWHDYVIPYGKITFLRGRIRFVDALYSAPFPSAVVVFYPSNVDKSLDNTLQT